MNKSFAVIEWRVTLQPGGRLPRGNKNPCPNGQGGGFQVKTGTCSNFHLLSTRRGERQLGGRPDLKRQASYSCGNSAGLAPASPLSHPIRGMWHPVDIYSIEVIVSQRRQKVKKTTVSMARPVAAPPAWCFANPPQKKGSEVFATPDPGYSDGDFSLHVNDVPLGGMCRFHDHLAQGGVGMHIAPDLLGGQFHALGQG